MRFMKHTSRLAWIGYFFVYLMASLSNLIALTTPDAKPFLFYQTLVAFTPIGIFWHAYALWAAILALASLWPLYARAFALPRTAGNLFKWIFILRVNADLFGHRYEILFFQSTWVHSPIAAILSATIALALVFPSYRALYEHAIKK